MGDATWAERALILVMIIASGGLFWWRFRKVASILQEARTTPDFSPSPWGPRVKKFVWEVMLQAKVIEQRPLPGLAHAFVFWGFLAFALITLNHFATAFGGRFLTPDEGFGGFYFGFVAVWAIAVAISIAGLFVRRFLVQPVWLGKVSPESGLIAMLILILMLTYLAGYWIGDETPAGQAVWWVHTAALLIFLPLIPHTKHLHLILSPATVLLKREGFSRYRVTKTSAWRRGRKSRASTRCRRFRAWNVGAVRSTAQPRTRGRY
jgi:hypothetical protein